MSDQLSFGEEHAHARRTDPETSKAAARSVDRIRESQNAVLACFRRYGSMCDTALLERYFEQGARSGWPKQSVSGIRTRRSELVDKGILRDSGLRVRLASGRRSIVWETV